MIKTSSIVIGVVCTCALETESRLTRLSNEMEYGLNRGTCRNLAPPLLPAYLPSSARQWGCAHAISGDGSWKSDPSDRHHRDAG